MCISMHPSRMTGTKIYAGEAMRGDVYVHVLAYENGAETQGANAMVLPIPAVSLGPENLIDTRQFPKFIGDILQAAKIPDRSRGLSRSLSLTPDSRAKVFDVGSYTIVAAESPEQITPALERVPVDKRPDLNEEVLMSFGHNYPGWPILVCCWRGTVKAEPILVWYEPLNKSQVFVPTLDSHDGTWPRQGKVQTDHLIALGSTLREYKVDPRSAPVRYQGNVPAEVKALLPNYVTGLRPDSIEENGDYFFHTSDGVVTRKYPGQEPSSLFAPKGWQD